MRSKIIKISLLCMMFVIVGLGIHQIVKYEVNAVKANISQRRASSGGTLASGEIDPNSYSYHTNTGGWWEHVEGQSGGSALGIPIHSGFEIYCIQPGKVVPFSWTIRYPTAMKENGTSRSQKCGCADTPFDGDYTPIVYTVESTDKLPPAMAYIVSDEGKGTWDLEKQKAIWNLRDSYLDGKRLDDNIIMGDGGHNLTGPTGYDQEAQDYAKHDSLVRDTGLKPTDKTKIDDVYTKINQDTSEYTVGPFNIEYTESIYGNIAFGGISEMTVIGYNAKKEEVRNNIKVDKIVLGNNAQVPQYFEPNDLKVDESKQVYPKSGQNFQVVFKDPNSGLASDDEDRVAYISLKIKFKYMLANGEYSKLKGTTYTVKYKEHHDNHTHPVYDDEGHVIGQRPCHDCTTTAYLSTKDEQYIMSVDAIRSIYEEELEVAKIGLEKEKSVNTTMDLGGHVWEDGVATKEDKADGISNTQGDKIDKPLKNVKVTLYTEDGEVATLLSDPDESGISNVKVMHRVNPTYTDEEGNYLFEGIDPMKKYYVRFEYNGQIYLPTEYLNTSDNTQYTSVNANIYTKNEWKVLSKGTEEPKERQDYDNQFAEVRSYPENYKTSNSLGKSGTYNAAFTQKDLMGYTLDRNGKYAKTGKQLIDGYLYDANGLETQTYSEGLISQKVREYIYSHREFPSKSAMMTIYSSIAGNNTEVWRQLQFIEDCKIESYTRGQGKQLDLYPVYEHFRINHAEGNEKYETAAEAQNGNYPLKSETIDGVTFTPIYPEQFFINQGLWRRQEFDAALRKDVYRAVMKINNKTVMYKYDKRTNDEAYWDINIRMSDYNAYYQSGYTREVYPTDYSYSSKQLNHPGKDLEIYITYKITIRNQSQSIMSQIKEVVDYYDKDYTYRNDLSWVTYVEGNKNNSVPDQEYYDAMAADDISKIKNARPTKAATSSKYGASTHSDIDKTYQSVYIKGLEDKKLATGESAYIYLTFQVNKQNGKVILDSESSPKENLAEINGYVTYYRNNTKLPNDITKNSGDIAGLLDIDSNPGNLLAKDIQDKDRYEKNFEDDTDRAKSLRIVIDNSAVRKANGTVWEDERTVKSGDSMIGNGVRDNNETKVAGVTVQLVEKTVDGKEYIWQETTTNANGYYAFESYIPGDYVIRFYYGNTARTTKIKGNQNYAAGGLNDVSYNGQDFKSTTYQTGMKQSQYTDESNRYTGYTNTTTQNQTGTYGYDIYASDSNKTNLSDAKDIWSVSNQIARTYRPNTTITEKKVIQGRNTVINYSNRNVTNHKAEVLASPYETPSYNGRKYTASEMEALINELIQNTYMTAETGVIAVEFEYDRQQSEGFKTTENNKNNSSNDYVTQSNRYNGGYELKNIDLGLTERPKAGLEIDKSITNIKVTLADGSVKFDANKAMDDVIWKDHTEYNLASKKDAKGKYQAYYGRNGKNRYSYREEVNKLVNKTDKGLVQITMDEELMHGANIEITYKLKVTNIGEVDYEGQKYYYLGDSTGANKVTTTANQVVDYVANNLKFDGSSTSNRNWSIANTENVKAQGLVNNRLSNNMAKFNNIIQTEGLNKALKPGENTEKALVLTQLISTENKSDDLTYSNIVEIVKISNTVGRRMAYSVVGNQDPTATQGTEVDSSVAEKVIILPPFGDAHIYYLLGITMAVILIGGIAIIIKKVLKK